MRIRAAAALLLLGAPVSVRLHAQTDARVVSALRLAQDGRIDSARSSLDALEKGVAPSDTSFAQVLYAQGLVAPTVNDARQRLQRVVSEYPLSPWADDAVMRLAQLEYANGDASAAMRQLEKFHGDYAASPLFPAAAAWAGRSLLRAKDTLAGCRWVAEGLGRAGQDAAARKELAALQSKCGGKAATRADAGAIGKPDSAPVVQPAAAVPVPPPTPVPSNRPAALPWRVQVIAAQTDAEANTAASRARSAGFDAIVVREGPYRKVRVGSYATRAEASAAASKVKAKLGGQPFVVQDK